MTLIVAMKTKMGIVLCSDSRGTIGDPRGLTAINDSQVKIFHIGNVGIGLAGASEMGAVLLDELNKTTWDSSDDVDVTVNNIFQQCAQLFNTWFGGIDPGERPGVLFTCVGYRKKNGKNEPMIYVLNSQANFAPQLFNSTCLTGVPQYAVYLIHRYYDEKISIDHAKALAEYLVSETASQDPKVGGPIKMAEVTPELGFREVPKEEIESISKANRRFNQKMKGFFLEGGKK